MTRGRRGGSKGAPRRGGPRHCAREFARRRPIFAAASAVESRSVCSSSPARRDKMDPKMVSTGEPLLRILTMWFRSEIALLTRTGRLSSSLKAPDDDSSRRMSLALRVSDEPPTNRRRDRGPRLLPAGRWPTRTLVPTCPRACFLEPKAYECVPAMDDPCPTRLSIFSHRFATPLRSVKACRAHLCDRVLRNSARSWSQGPLMEVRRTIQHVLERFEPTADDHLCGGRTLKPCDRDARGDTTMNADSGPSRKSARCFYCFFVR
jgi:hypothetical protein